MQLQGPHTFHTNEFIPFSSTSANWATAGADYLITFDSKTNHFTIPKASENDYFIIWYLELKTSSTSKYPISGLEFLYGENYRCDYSIAPCKTVQFCNSAIYHISSILAPDVLSIGLKMIGDTNDTYTLSSVSNCNITSNINILGL